MRYSYLSRGHYFEQISRWLNYFDREQLLVIKSKNFFDNTRLSLNKVFEHIGIKKYQLDIKQVHNKGKYKNEIKEKTLTKIENYYKGKNEKMYKLVGKKFNW